ncbi:uncharacterized protein LOC143859617 [Tasmannia lanceolata]|uniref:uncharacterized protein LOC143859617 n=1 Tax=Tasmannia lanceolata TaxID=3420 RepID=UPI0040641F30
MGKLVSLKHIADKGVREHIIGMHNVPAQLQALKIKISESFLEEGRIRQEKLETTNLVIRGKNKGKKVRSVPMKKKANNSLVNQTGATEVTHVKCFFCRKKGHVKKDCIKYKKWLENEGMVSQRTPTDSERFIFSGNKIRSRVEAVGTYQLRQPSGYVLLLEKTFYIPSFSRNLISVSKLLTLDMNLSFSFSLFNIVKDSIIGNGSLIDGLYRLNLDPFP